MIQTIREWFYTRRIIRNKRRAIFEMKQDMRYIETQQKDMLHYNEGPARKRMAEIKAKEEPTEIEESELENILSVIATSKAVKQSYNETKKVMEDNIVYLNMLLS